MSIACIVMQDCVSICGDGLQSSEERCDDGNTAAGDGCDASCKYVPQLNLLFVSMAIGIRICL